MHTGLHDAKDVVVNATTGRTQYTGPLLSTAKAVADCAHGGMVVLSSATFSALPVARLSSLGTLLNMGEYRFTSELVQPGAVYQVVAPALRPRLSVLEPTLRTATQLQLGVLQAPVGRISIAFANVVGAAALLAWDAEVARRALELFHHKAAQLMISPAGVSPPAGDARRSTLSLVGVGGGGGAPQAASAIADQRAYVVEMAGGLCLASFPTSSAAILWALRLVDALLVAEWEPALLAHELCEEVCVGRHMASPSAPTSADLSPRIASLLQAVPGARRNDVGLHKPPGESDIRSAQASSGHNSLGCA